MAQRSSATLASQEIILERQRPTALIELRNLVKTYSNAAGDFRVLKGINAQFSAGEFVAVIGRSGSGKSTLINMIAGIDRPTSGEIYVGDTAVHTLSEGAMAVWRGQQLGIVFQFFQLLPMLSLLENIMLPMDFCHMYTPRQRRERSLQLLERVEMREHAYKLPSAISGGQQQRVAIARALANDPPIILADEPTGNLDSQTAEAIFDLFRELVDQGKTVLMVTHDTSQAQRVDRTMLLVDGEIANQYVAHALSALSHEQVMEATRNVRPLHFAPGATIIQQGAHSDTFYIVSQGVVEVSLKRAGGSDVIVSRMREGEYFGEIELMRDTQSLATVRASEYAPVEVLALDRQAFIHLLAESDETREAIDQMVRLRETENRANREAEV